VRKNNNKKIIQNQLKQSLRKQTHFQQALMQSNQTHELQLTLPTFSLQGIAALEFEQESK